MLATRKPIHLGCVNGLCPLSLGAARRRRLPLVRVEAKPSKLVVACVGLTPFAFGADEPHDSDQGDQDRAGGQQHLLH